MYYLFLHVQRNGEQFTFFNLEFGFLYEFTVSTEFIYNFLFFFHINAIKTVITCDQLISKFEFYP